MYKSSEQEYYIWPILKHFQKITTTNNSSIYTSTLVLKYDTNVHFVIFLF